MAATSLDRIDIQILAALQENARTSNTDIARTLDMAPSAILERIRKLEQRGVIAGYEVRVAPRAVGLGLTAFLFLRADEKGGAPATSKALTAIPEVLEVHSVAGEDCFMVKVRARDTDDLARLLKERFSKLPHLTATRTTIVLSTLKEANRIPLETLPLAND